MLAAASFIDSSRFAATAARQTWREKCLGKSNTDWKTLSTFLLGSGNFGGMIDMFGKNRCHLVNRYGR